MKFFTKKNYKRLMILPFILAILFLYLIIFSPGLERGIDLKGGNQIIVHYENQRDFSQLETKLKENFNLQEIRINETKNADEYGLLIEFSQQTDIENVRSEKANINFKTTNTDNLKQEVRTLLQPLLDKGFLLEVDLVDLDNLSNIEDIKQFSNDSINLANSNYNSKVINLIKEELQLEDLSKIQTREIAATLGKDFISSSIKVGLVAFVLLITVILLFFRELIPSGLIIFAAIFDILAALAGMALFKLPLSLTTIPALLMLIGYSVDTDILLSTKVLKNRSHNAFDAAHESMKTGITMTLTTLATIVVMLIVSYTTQMLIVFEITTVLLCGLVGDIISTWWFNAPALIAYVEGKKVKK